METKKNAGTPEAEFKRELLESMLLSVNPNIRFVDVTPEKE